MKLQDLVTRYTFCRKNGHFPIVAKGSPRLPVYFCYCIYCHKQLPLWDVSEDLRMRVWR